MKTALPGDPTSAPLKPGDRFRAIADTRVRVWITYSAPSTSSAEALLTAGETIIVHDIPPGAGWVFAKPERKELESILVPEPERSWVTYGGYALVIELESLRANFTRIR